MLEPFGTRRFDAGLSDERISGVVSAAGSEIELVLETTIPDVYTAYSWKNVVFLLWFGPITVESLKSFEKACKANRAARPEGSSTVNLMIPGGSSFPSADARTGMLRILREHGPQLAASAVVLCGTGFWASALGSVITAISMLAPRDFKLRMFNTLGAVAEWLPALHEARTQVKLDPSELLLALQLVEAKGLAMAREKARVVRAA
jgi:hypothetical protein